MGELVDATVPVVVKPSVEILVMRVQTKFRTEDEFVVAFRRYCSDTTCFVPTTTPRTVGIETGFSIRLADGTPMLRGLCVVLDSWETDENPYRRPGLRLGLRSLTRETQPIFDRICTASLAVGSSPDLAAQARDEIVTQTMDAVPMPIDVDEADATERMPIDTVPMRAPIPTLLGVAPIAISRTMTPRERVTMARLTATGTQTVIVKDDPPEPAAPPPAIVVRRRSWWNRAVWRMRAWWRTRVWAWQRR